jgi:formylglycine-generating enzyme required for sulfatase activity
VETLLASLYLFQEGRPGEARALVRRLTVDAEARGFLRKEGLEAFDRLLAGFDTMVGIPRPGKKRVGLRETLTAPKVLFVDVHEVSRRRFLAYLEKNSLPRKPWPDSFWEEDALDLPMTRVTWKEAADFASAEGKRLPTPDEWMGAALVDRFFCKWKYPWGGEEDLAGVNVGGSGDRPWPATKGGRDRSPCGAMNFFGNVREWCSDSKIGLEPGATAPVLGFSWVEKEKNLELPGRFPEPPGLRSPTMGFRCVRNYPSLSRIMEIFRAILG